jgi:hypothetical protein
MRKKVRVFDVDAAGRAAAFEDQLSAVRVLLQKALVCSMKFQAWPDAPDVPDWLTEAALLRSQASRQCSAEINKRLVAQRIYRWALKDLPDEVDGVAARPIPEVCPVTIDQLLAFGLPLNLTGSHPSVAV